MGKLKRNTRELVKNSEIETNYDINEVKRYLEEKYNQSFIINPDYVSNAGSFIPGNIDNPTVYYKTYAKDDLNFGFRVYRYSDFNENKKTGIMEDGYCWKYFREQIRDYFNERMKNRTFDNYKLAIEIAPSTTFNNNIKPESPIELYFNNSNKKVSLYFYLILNSGDNINEIKEISFDIIQNFYKKYDNNMYIYFICFKTSSDRDFNSLNQFKKENGVFVELKEFAETEDKPWGVNLETLFTIEDFDFNSIENR